MGKSSKSKRFGAFKPSPTGLLSEKDLELSLQLEGDQLVQNVPGIIVNILEKLQAASTEERACGCQMMASLVCQPKAIDHLMKHNVTRIVAPFFLDSNTDIQRNALGAMRNISIYGEQKACDLMVKEDIFTPLSALIKKFGNGWTPGKDTDKQPPSSVLIEAVELSSNLCENSAKALHRFNAEELITVLLPMLQVDLFDYPLSCAVAQCLHVVSENNQVILHTLQQPEVVAGLGRVVMAPSPHIAGVLFKVFVAGILMNLTEVDMCPYYDSIIGMASQVLDMDCLPLIHGVLDKLKGSDQKEEFNSDTMWQEVDQLMSSQSICLELLANLCCSDEEWEEMDGSEEDISDDLLPSASNSVAMAEENQETLSNEVLSALTKYNVLTKILTKATPFEAESMSHLVALKSGKEINRKLEDLQSRALLCLSNMISALSGNSLSQLSVTIPTLWVSLYDLGKSTQGRGNEDSLWAITSAMRAVLQHMADLHPNQIKSVTEIDLNFLVSLGTQCQNTETQVNVVKIISIIGCVLSADASTFAALKTLGSILIQVASSSNNTVVIAEALDSIFDVFKEDETDPVAKDIGLVEKLKILQPTFKAKISSERKKLGESYGLVMMARTNLNGFLKYKETKR